VLAADLLPVALLTTAVRNLTVLLTFGIAAAVWKAHGLYRRRIAMSVLDDLPIISSGVLIALGPATTIAMAFGSPGLREVLLTGAGILLGATFGRAVAYSVILRRRASGRSTHRTVMVGSGAAAESLARRIRAHPESGLRLLGRLTTQDSGEHGSLPLLGTTRDLSSLVSQQNVTDVVIGYGGMSAAELVDVLRNCERANLEIYVVPRLFELHALSRADDHIWGLPLVRLRSPAQRLLTWRLKRAFDIVVSSVGLLLATPIMLPVALAVRLELGRGILFTQTRIGRQGRPFQMLKFRSMRAGDGPTPWAVPEERLGHVGRFIRHYSLDELPQLFNVLRGDMSLVGPRPERPEYVEEFCAAVPRYLHRHRLPVGLTGLAAVNGLRGDTSLADRVQFDNWYIDNWSFWLDVKILLRTLRAVLRGSGT
jgi:exopolysaccharide biosynthesis polyprenyl glycosylphosphotransferase